MAGTLSELRSHLCVVSALVGSAAVLAIDLEAREGVERLQCLLDEAELHAVAALALADHIITPVAPVSASSRTS